ncbi:MAG: pyridoxal phosphate-dependent aminotransferase [Gammaproteobacteria bacterium]
MNVAVSNAGFAARIGRVKPSPTIAVSDKARELKAAGRDIINLGSGEPDFDTPQHIKDAANDAIKRGDTKYTAVGGTAALKQAVADKLRRENNLHYEPGQIVISTGAKQALMNVMLSLIDDGDEVVIIAPYWVSYPDMALLAGGAPVFVRPQNPRHIAAPAELAAALGDKTKLVILNSPSNPAGTLYSADELRALGEVLADYPNVAIASDDIYEHIRYDGKPFATIAEVCPQLAARTIVINGVSKAFAMTGWRIGYCASALPIAKAMTKVQSQSTSNPCSIAQAAALAALEGGTECLKPMLAAFDSRRRRVVAGLNSAAGLSCAPVEGAFYAFANAAQAIGKLHNDGKLPAADDICFCNYLLEKAGVAAVPGSAFGMDGFFRISFAAPDADIDSALQRINDALA